MTPSGIKLMTAVELAQMAGSCVRSDKDVGHTYIIDPSFMFHFERGMSNNESATISIAIQLPPYVAESIMT